MATRRRSAPADGRAVRRPPHLCAQLPARYCATGRPAVPDRRLQSGSVRARPDARQGIVLAGRDRPLPETYYARYPAWRFLAPACTTEVVTGSEGTGITPGRPVPGEILRRLAWRPRREPPRVRHVSGDGRPLHSLSIQGTCRLAESSAADLETVLAGPPGQTAPVPAT